MTLAWRSDGPADGTPLVLLNSIGSSTEMWTPCLTPLAEQFRVLRIDTRGHPSPDNPDPRSPVLSTGVDDPGGVCVDDTTGLVWVPDRAPGGDVLHLVIPGPLPTPAWRWTDGPGVGGCAAHDGTVTIAEANGTAAFVLHGDRNGLFSGQPDTLLKGVYGRLGPATLGPDGFQWFGTDNKAGGTPVSSDDRVIRIQMGGGGGADRA